MAVTKISAVSKYYLIAFGYFMIVVLCGKRCRVNSCFRLFYLNNRFNKNLNFGKEFSKIIGKEYKLNTSDEYKENLKSPMLH